MFFEKLKNLKKKHERPTQAELSHLVERYNHMTAELPEEWALEHLDTPELSHWIMLLKIADYKKPLGKLEAIQISFKLGYLYGQGEIDLGIPDYYYDDSYWVREYRERTSKILAETENADTLAQIYYFAKRAGKAGRRNDGK